MDFSLTGLRVLREIAERGTFTAAAEELGYTQSAVSRQVAALERVAGTALFDRGTAATRLTPAGLTLLRHARLVLDELAAARRELSGDDAVRQEVRLGAYISAGAALLPATLTSLRRQHPEIRVTTREGTTPALVRALRAGTLDLAVISSRAPHRPPDTELPRLTTETLAESNLVIAAPATGRFAGRDAVAVAELIDVDWIASPSSAAEPLMGVWPGLPGRPRIAHHARDWLTKLRLVAAGCGVTTIPTNLAPTLPDGVIVLRVLDGLAERRRMVLARLPGTPSPAISCVIRALHAQHDH
ncbi:LysR family transcriptional regulator [Mycobacterium sp. pUA109]|uniref:LysR family transcriptional regulator n=1 Tax=Mycobacterium sp. pUA109 TaxID=3238982 RepID=UPI00351BE6C6